MYSYNYNIPQNQRNMYRSNGSGYMNPNMNDERFFAGGFIAPLLLGGVAGYAIGQNNNNNRPMYYYPQPYYYYPANFSNNYYYSPYYY